MKRKFCFSFIFLIGVCSLFGLDSITLEPPYIDSDSETAMELERILSRSALLANKLYPNYFRVSSDPVKGEGYSVSIVAVGTGEETTVSMTMLKPGSEEEISMAVLGPLSEGRIPHFANLFFYMWSSFHDYLLSQLQPPPVLIEEFSTDAIAQTVSTGTPMQLFPYSAAVKQNGNILVAFISLCVEMEGNFKIVGQPGKVLTEQGNYTYAYGVAATPGGTVYLKPSAGREVYKIIEGAPKPVKVKTGMEVQGPFVLLPDGSIVLIDMVKKKAMRIDGKKRYNLDLFPGPYSFISTAAAGPEGNLWVFDSMEKRVLIFSPEGVLLDTVLPVVPKDISLSPFSMDVYPDGSFVLFSTGELWKFRKNGEPAWRLNTVHDESLSQTMTVALDKEKGIIYLIDVMGRRILKLLDAAYAQTHSAGNPFDESVIKLTARIFEDPDNTDLYEEKAELYQTAGAYELAKAQWEAVLDIDPFNGAAQEKIDYLDMMILSGKASELRDEAIDLLETLGPESARQTYRQALQVYERIFSLDEEAVEAKRDFEDLKRRYREKSAVPDEQKGFKILKVTMENMFPSLIHQYRDHPVGMVTVKNILDSDIRGIKASVSLRKYTDFPAESEELPLLKTGEEAEIPLYLTFNEEVFSLQEDLPVQLRIEVKGQAGGTEVVEGIGKTSTLYRRTALTWDDTSKLASFIMPNEQVVSGFSHRVLNTDLDDSDSGFTSKMEQAVRICNALGSYGINYVEDPDSPISRILGRQTIVDTVRFPRTTLYIKSGDCDDSTALLTSLFESAGIRSAILTSPGHVFCAFDSGEPEGNGWLFTTENTVAIPFDGTLWIPVETTILQKGFQTAWQEASSLVRQYSAAGELEFLPVHTIRDKYPPLPIGEGSFVVAEPPESEIDRLFDDSISGIKEELHAEGIAGLERTITEKDNRSQLKQKNRIGILHARFGKPKEAENIFNELIRENPQYLSPYINLANLKLKVKRFDEAISILEEGLEIKPTSPQINLLLARSYHALEDKKEAGKYFAKVKDVAPAIAMRYSYLEVDGPAAGRAASAGSEMDGFLWVVEE
jgi:tetratricopeptide (TPR) repeat protein